MTELPMTKRRARRLRRATAALVALAALTAAGCSSGGSKSSLKSTDSAITTHAKKKKKKLTSDTDTFSSSPLSTSKKRKVKSTKNLSTDMHDQMQDRGSITTTDGDTFTAGSISFTIPAGWQQGTDDSGNSVILNQSQGAKVTVLQDPDYQGGGATQELKSLEQQLSDTVSVTKEAPETSATDGSVSLAYFVGQVIGQQGYVAVVAAITTQSEGYALLATLPSQNADAVSADLNTMLNSITAA